MLPVETEQTILAPKQDVASEIHNLAGKSSMSFSPNQHLA